jgi:hypothetical protein
MIPLASVAAFLPPESSKVFYRDDLVALYGDVTAHEKYLVLNTHQDRMLIQPLGKYGKCNWHKMNYCTLAGFLA